MTAAVSCYDPYQNKKKRHPQHQLNVHALTLSASGLKAAYSSKSWVIQQNRTARKRKKVNEQFVTLSTQMIMKLNRASDVLHRMLHNKLFLCCVILPSI
jgi:K+-transporting ATPase c subunit